MSELITRTAKLLPRTKRIKPVPGFATAYHYEAGEEAGNLGTLYVVIEVLTGFKQAEAVADLVIETVGNNYYNVEHSENATILERFEAAVKATNQALADYANAGNASWVGRMSAVIAILADQELHITQTGSAEAYLYRSNVTSHVTTNLADKGPHRPINTFANIASGELEVHDRLLIATPALFHQLQRSQLKSLITDNTATGTVQKLSELISKQDDADRIAGIIVEITTPELLALQVKTDEPEEVEIGQGDKPLEVAKAIATPAARSIANASKAVGSKAAEQTKTKVLPKLRSAGWTITEQVRSRLSTSKGRRQLILVVVVLLAIGIGFFSWQGRDKVTAGQISRYDAIYQEYAKGRNLFDQGNKTEARAALETAQTDLNTLNKSVSGPNFAKQLTKHVHPESDPASIPQLSADITGLIDQIDGVVSLQGTVLSDFSKIKSAQPTKMELLGNKLILVDSQTTSKVYVYDLTTKTLVATASLPGSFGHIVASTPSGNNDGIYLLTDKPSVWFYKGFDSSLTEVSISFGSWPKGRAIANYNNNLYLLAADSTQVFKHIPTAGGFAAGTPYFTNGPASVAGATTMAIDGSIYLAGSKIQRYVSGKLTATLDAVPSQLQHPSQLRSLGDGSRLMSLDDSSHRIGLYSVATTSLSFDKQIILKNALSVYAVTADTKGNTLYAVIDGKLVSAALPN